MPPYSSRPLAARVSSSAFTPLGGRSPVAFPRLAQLMGARPTLAPVGFLSAKLLAQLGCCLFPCSSAWNFHSQSSIELHPFF